MPDLQWGPVQCVTGSGLAAYSFSFAHLSKYVLFWLQKQKMAMSCKPKPLDPYVVINPTTLNFLFSKHDSYVFRIMATLKALLLKKSPRTQAPISVKTNNIYSSATLHKSATKAAQCVYPVDLSAQPLLCNTP